MSIIKLKSYEHIVFTLRRHPLTFIPTIGLFVVLMMMPIAVYIMIINLFPQILSGDILYPLSVLFASVYYLSLCLFFFGQFIDFYLDMWVITNDRIIDVEQHSLFHRVITELELFRIQDVTTEVRGVFHTVFDYGNVIVKTASNTSGIVFFNVPHPNHVREQLIILAAEDAKYHQAQS